MGLLTDPSGDQGKLTKFLLKYYGKLCVILYIGGIAWFCALASPAFNSSTYFSENALLPGLVRSMFYEDRTAHQYLQELQDETKKYDSSIPYSWLLAKFQQIGLDAYTHNFTLHSPLNPNESYYGKNVYGILRAPRASSTEALVLSVPYRPPKSVYPTTLPAIGIQLAFAKFAIKEKFWAKDIIFLVTDHEQLGMQAWLEAYHVVTCGNEGILDHGKLRGRAGAIQAAINLELHSTKIGQIDIKIEGLNGQLPNLDLFNLAGKICIKEGVLYTFKGKTPEYHRDPYKEWLYYFKNMLNMMSTQATGIPNGNHGLFLRFGIQALTLEGFERGKGGSRVGLVSMGRVIEGIFRSMNNLLERFHQSFFFYILPSYDRYISIGLYMPAACMIAASLIIRACAKWYQLREKESSRDLGNNDEVEYINIVILFVFLHVVGAFIMMCPEMIIPYSHLFPGEVSRVVFLGLVVVIVVTLLIPFFLRDIRTCSQNLTILSIFALLELGTALICLSMTNIALGMFCGVVSVPVALTINLTPNKYYRTVLRGIWLIMHPLVIIFLVVLVNTFVMFGQEELQNILFRALDATQQAVTFGIVDSMIYGNWLYTVVTLIFIPNWLCFWCIVCNRLQQVESKPKKD